MQSLPIPVASFWTDHRDEITAVVTVIIAVGLARFIDHYLVNRASRMASAVSGPLSPVATTRLRLVRRLVSVFIVAFGILLALSQFDGITRVATGLLASSAVLGIVVGFAARQTLANAIAGILLAVVQPIRIGDLVTFEEQTGTVEDVGLTYTWLRTGADARLLVPNERLAGGIIRNDSIRSPTVAVEVSVWLGPGADETAALEALRALEGVRARVAETTVDGFRILVMSAPGPPSERLAREGDLRATALGALRTAGVR
jgi:small-conductance mechanosensitive channel